MALCFSRIGFTASFVLLLNETSRSNQMMTKKSSLTSTQLTLIILAILGFSLLLFLFVRFLFQENIDATACHESVVVRGTASALSGLLQSYVPLKCKTQKYCITAKSSSEGNGDCSADFKGEESQVSNVRVTNVQDIERFVSRQMADCWAMMGEGKISLFSQWFANEFGFTGIYPTCVVCARIAYDSSSLAKKNIDLNKINLGLYMGTHQMPDRNISYIEYLGGQPVPNSNIMIGALSTQDIQAETQNPQNENQAPIPNIDEFKDIKDSDLYNYVPIIASPTKEQAIMFMQITAPSKGEAFKHYTEAALAIFGITNRYFIPGSWATIGKTTTTTGTDPYSSESDPFGQLPEHYRKVPVGTQVETKSSVQLGTRGKVAVVALAFYLIGAGIQQITLEHNQVVAAGYCGTVSSGSEAREGCSRLMPVEYNFSQISSYCQEMADIP